MTRAKISPTMLDALKLAHEHGNGWLYMHPGGYWRPEETVAQVFDRTRYHGTMTVEALIARGFMSSESRLARGQTNSARITEDGLRELTGK